MSSAQPVRPAPVRLALLPLVCAGGLGAAIARLAGAPVPAWLLLATLLGLLATIGLGVFVLSSGIFARPILAAGPHSAGRIALTFDDGPDPVHTLPLLDLLERGGHRATFFVIGARAERSPEVIAAIARRGHGLGNHSYAHSHRTPITSAKRLAAELTRAGEVLAAAGGVAPRWFRPPIGLISPPVAAAARLAGLELVGWTATARDGTARATVEKSLARLRPALRPGAILVLHDAAERGGREPIAHALLTALLDELAQRGLRSVTLDDLLL